MYTTVSLAYHWYCEYVVKWLIWPSARSMKQQCHMFVLHFSMWCSKAHIQVCSDACSSESNKLMADVALTKVSWQQPYSLPLIATETILCVQGKVCWLRFLFFIVDMHPDCCFLLKRLQRHRDIFMVPYVRFWNITIIIHVFKRAPMLHVFDCLENLICYPNNYRISVCAHLWLIDY